MFNISIKALTINLVVTIIGVFLALGLFHLYMDHKLVDAIRVDIASRQANAQQQSQKAPN